MALDQNMLSMLASSSGASPGLAKLHPLLQMLGGIEWGYDRPGKFSISGGDRNLSQKVALSKLLQQMQGPSAPVSTLKGDRTPNATTPMEKTTMNPYQIPRMSGMQMRETMPGIMGGSGSYY